MLPRCVISTVELGRLAKPSRQRWGRPAAAEPACYNQTRDTAWRNAGHIRLRLIQRRQSWLSTAGWAVALIACSRDFSRKQPPDGAGPRDARLDLKQAGDWRGWDGRPLDGAADAATDAPARDLGTPRDASVDKAPLADQRLQDQLAPDLCPVCDPAVSDGCVGGQCVCGSGAACGAGLNCVDGFCRCISGGRCNGCCSGDVCQFASAANCGQNGSSCQSCTQGRQCVAGSCECPASEELCDGRDNTCDGDVDEGCCPTGMTWDSALGLCWSGPFAEAIWATAQSNCRSRGGCIGQPHRLGLGVCGSWFDGHLTARPSYRYYGQPDGDWTGLSLACTIRACDTEQCGGCSDPRNGFDCSQRYFCMAEPLKPKRLPCTRDSDCGRDQQCNGSGACVLLSPSASGGTRFCCQDGHCASEDCARPSPTTGRCQPDSD